MRRRSCAQSILAEAGFTTPSPRLVRGPFGSAFSLLRPRSGDVRSAVETNGDALSSFVFRCFLARVRGVGVVGMPPLATGPLGTTAARNSGSRYRRALSRSSTRSASVRSFEVEHGEKGAADGVVRRGARSGEPRMLHRVDAALARCPAEWTPRLRDVQRSGHDPRSARAIRR